MVQDTAVLPGRVRRGCGLGSVATGAFGTVPGLLLLPYLTDRLGVAAGLAGLIVLLPKAWDVLLNPIAGRVSDRSTHPDGRRRPFLVRAGAEGIGGRDLVHGVCLPAISRVAASSASKKR